MIAEPQSSYESETLSLKNYCSSKWKAFSFYREWKALEHVLEKWFTYGCLSSDLWFVLENADRFEFYEASSSSLVCPRAG